MGYIYALGEHVTKRQKKMYSYTATKKTRFKQTKLENKMAQKQLISTIK